MGLESSVRLQWSHLVFQLSSDSYYQASRRRNNNLERIRTPVENEIIEELVEWSMYIYATGE
jgi:hypothetical protein